MKYILDHTSASIGGIFLNIQAVQHPRMCHIRYKFGCDQSIYNGNLPGEEGATASIPQILSEYFFCKFILKTTHAWAVTV
jgi:hypothetical protein